MYKEETNVYNVSYHLAQRKEKREGRREEGRERGKRVRREEGIPFILHTY